MIAHGARVGTYEVHERIGGGSTGEVFRARDGRLGRDVALKILSEPFRLDARHRVLFEREARVLASLNHPNIATLHGIEEADEAQALVLEFVDGCTLGERLADGPIPLRRALEISQQVTAALEAAHERGVVHRDLKPDNIKIRADGTVKVLDFGIARVLHPIAQHGDVPQKTFTLVDGLQGRIVGTPSYMSPEQARGQPVDERADIWSFGCVLYEMLTGRRAFRGETASDCIVAVLDREPDWTALPQDCPPLAARVLRRCLEKEGARRLRHIGDARADLGDALADLGDTAQARLNQRSPPPSDRRLPLYALVGRRGWAARPRAAIALALGAVTLSVASHMYWSSHRLGNATAAPARASLADRTVTRQPNSIAVLPFDSLSADVDDAFFAAGLHEEVLSRLARLSTLHVTSRTSVLRYAGSQWSIPEIAGQLGVGAVVEGSVRYAGNQLLVTAQLIDADTDSNLWSETFRADRSDIGQIFAIQADIASAIAAALGTEMSADEQGRISTRSAAGYARYLRALNYCRDRRFAESIRELNAAIALDSEFAEAYALRAMIHAFAQVTSGARVQLLADGRSNDEDFEALALAEAARALELDERAGLAWAARAVTHAFHFRMGAARTAFRQALEASPNNSDILVHYASFEAHFGSVDEALALVERAARLDPAGTLTWSYVAEVQMAAGLVAEANASLSRALSFDPANVDAVLLAGLFNADPEAGERLLRTADELDSPMHLQGIALGYQRLGLESDADRALDRYEQWAKSEQGSAGAAEWSQYYLLRGDLDAAYEWLRKAIDKIESGEPDEGFYALQYTFINPTHPALAEPRFQQELRRLERLRDSR